jgi:acyl dehydratase
VADGWLTLSLAAGLEYALLRVGPGEDDPILGLYGVDRIRFTAPVFIGDRIHLEGEVLAREERDPARGLVTLRIAVTNQDGATVAVLDKKLLYKRRASEEPA